VSRPVSTKTSRCRRGGGQIAQALRRLDGKFGAQHLAVQLILPACFGGVALGEVGLDQDPVGTLAQRLGADSGQAGVNSLAVTALTGQPFALRFECVNAQLPESFPLDQHPLVVTSRQQFARQLRPGVPAQIGFARFQAVEEPMGERLRAEIVDRYPERQPDVPCPQVNE